MTPEETQGWLSQQLSSMSPVDTVVHLGAGVGSALGLWVRCGAKRIILVEPNSECLPELRNHSAGIDQVEILTTAVSNKAGRFELNLFNDASFSSLRAPTDLMEIMPGLVRSGQISVDCQTAGQLLNDLQMDEEDNNWLVIDTPGEEAAVLQSLLGSELRHVFSVVVLRAGAEPLYEGAVAAEALLMKLKNIGYTVNSADLSDADVPRYCLTLDRLALKNAELLARVAELEDALLLERERSSEQAQEIKAYKAMMAEAEAEHAKVIARLNEQLTSLSQSNGDQEQKQQQFEKVVQSRDNLKSQLQKCTEESHKLKIRGSQLEEENSEYRERHKLLEEELIKAEAQIELIKQLFLSGDNVLDWDDMPGKS